MKFNSVKLFLLSVACTISLCLSAQQKNDSTKTVRSVEIERDYTPEAVQVERPNIDLQTEEPKIEKSKPTFSNYFAPYSVNPPALIPLPPQETGTLNREDSKKGFLRLGFGPLFNWLADFWYPVWNTKEGYFDFFLHHNGIYSLGKQPKKLINTDVGFNFKKNFNDNQFYISALYANESFNYYGQDTSLNDNKFIRDFSSNLLKNQSFNKADITIGLKSKERNSNDLLWNAFLNYHLHSTTCNTEHNVNAIAQIDKSFNENSLVVEGGAMAFFYQNKPLDTLKIDRPFISEKYNEWKPNVVLFLKPAFLMNFNSVKIKLGVKSFFSFGRNPYIAVSPDVKLDYFLKDFLNLYVGVTGDYKVNSLAQTTFENRYYNLNSTEHNTYTPFDLFAGFKVKMLKGLMLDAAINYKYVFDAMFFKNNLFNISDNLGTDYDIYNPYFKAVYNNGALFEAKARLNYNIKERVNIYASMQYDKWSLKQPKDSTYASNAWHTPEWRFDAGTEFKIGKGFFGNVNFYCVSKMKAEKNSGEIVALPAVYDLNIGAGYNISKDFSVFARANNILAASPSLNPQIWYGYKTMGLNFLIGMTLQF